MKPTFTNPNLYRKHIAILITGFLLFMLSITATAQLGTYSFTGSGACPNPNAAINSQPANAVFSNYNSVNTSCQNTGNVFDTKQWNISNTLDLAQYNEFSITPNASFTLTLSGITFTEFVDQDPGSGTTNWYLRSSLDGYAADIATGTATGSNQTPSITLPAANFTNIGAVTFRLYITNAASNGTKWTNDEVIITGTLNGLVPADPANPTSNSPQCATTGVTMNFTGSAPAGETWYWQTSATGTSTANSTSAYTVNTAGTYYVRSRDNTTLAWSSGAGSITVAMSPTVGAPVFTLGATSTRCQGAGTAMYDATASNSTLITYGIDATSAAAGNYFANSTIPELTYAAGWSGTTTITATAQGCNGPVSSTHTVTITTNVGTPVFTLGATSSRCIGSGTVTYNASATNNTGITYTLDQPSLDAGCTINQATGAVTWWLLWSGTSTVTATATGCGTPTTATHTVTTNAAVTTPVFAAGATSNRCQGAGTVTYTATANNTTGITYSLTGGGGSTITAATGAVTWVAGFSGTATITASAAGCNGPKTATHTVTVNAAVTTPVFTLGATSTRCQAAGSVTYTATASNSTGITYTIDATTVGSAGNTFDPSTGTVTYDASWSGTSTITASAAGCGGPKTSTHTVTTTPTVGTPVFTAGATSTRCQGAGTVTYGASASNSTSITYSLTGAGSSTIVAATGAVTWAAAFSGTATITASAAGCNGPATAIHTVTVTPTVGTPVFTAGATSTRCQGAGIVTYDAAATNTTGITYSLSGAGTSTINATTGDVTWAAAFSGTATITASAAGCNGPKTATHTVTVTPTVGTPVFTSGATSTRCQGANTVTYTATATNNTGITYSLDATTAGFGTNTFNTATGAVTYDATWTGTSIITASAAGCNGPKTATHTVTTTITVGTPVFALGATSTRCQGAGTVTYTATAANATGITYSIDALSDVFNSINASTGVLTYSALWFGTTTITATAAGCNGPTTATHTATVTATVGTPVFVSGSTSTRCQGGGAVTYTASATNSTNITYTLDATTAGFAGNSFDPSTGTVTYAAAWSGTSTITASAAGCNGPKTATHTVTTTPTVGTPVFTIGATSTRCQGAGTVTYTATATNSTSLVYSVDATTAAFAGNSFNTTTGALTYAAGWSGTSTISVFANGCNGPSATVTHTVTITPTVGTPVFTLGATSIRCQGAGSVTYDASATNSTTITYSLSAGGSIVSTTGVVTWTAGFSGTATITASAAGCNGPKTATHTVTVTPTVGTPVFTLGATSTRCQGAGTVTYTANATNNTGITYTLDAATAAFAGNSFNTATGAVTYDAAWSGTSVITASATGCNGPKTATHTVTITATVGTPVFALGATSVRCQGAGSVAYTATATTSTSITYALDATSAATNSINTNTGVVAYVAGWSGTTTITATANGCNGPSTATHTVTVTPTVGTPVFVMGATSTHCQGANTITYTASATNSTGITYSLDATTAAYAGNSIVTATGAVTYAAGWTGTTVITASAAGCNGPKTATHTVTITPTVTAPVFAMGLQSIRTQGAATITYSATANYTTGITYSLDASSLSGSNTINAGTGAVTWNANWYGSSVITASAAGCNGPVTSFHIVNINPSIVQAPLYLSTPGQILDRIDPVATGITTTVQTGVLSNIATTNTTFSLNPALCSDLTIKAQTIGVQLYLSIASGTMPVNPNITALIKYGSTNIINLINPVYNSATGILSWTGTLGTDVIVPSGQPIDLVITTAQAGVTFKIDYHSNTKPSRISLFPVSTFIDFVSFDVYTAPYPGGIKRVSGLQNTTYYVRAVVTTPFGYKDITSLDLKINPPGSTVTVSCVDSSTCTRTYEYPWTTSNTPTVYYLLATAKEGYENIIKNSELLAFDVCSNCPPVAINDSAIGAGGAPLIVDVLLNDYDPNNNIKKSTLAITVQPRNGTGYVSNNKIVYLPNGTYAGKDTLTYQICDSTGNCGTARVFFTTNPLLIDPCSEATKTHTYFIPYPEQDAWTALQASSSTALPSGNIRSIISLTMPYPGMTIVWDEWEDGYEINALNPTQATTKVWGDGNPYNGIAPGYASDNIPAGGSIVLDNTMPSNPRVQANVFYDGKDKITGSGQVAVTQVCGEPTNMPVQAIKTNVTSTLDFGQSFTIPLGQNFPSQDFKYTALFIRAQMDSTVVDIDKDNNGSFETSFRLNQGQSYLVNGGVNYGATVTSNLPVGVELNAGGIDGFSIRNAPIYPATWYSNTYYSPVPTSDNAGDNPKDTSAVMLYNSLNRPITINWNSGAPANGTITLPAKSVVRFPLAYSTTSAYKFYNPTGESFTAIEVVDSYTPGGGGNDGQTYDWAFNLIAEARLTDFATTAWAPGGLDLVAPAGPDVNGNPIWVTPNVNTTIYVKWDGKVSGTTGLASPCGLRYDSSFTLNALKYAKLRDFRDNDQSGLAVYTCNGAKIAAVYGEDPQGSSTGIGIAYWDVGTTILPFCKQKLIFANDDYARTMINQPVTIPILLNDFGFLAVVDPTSVTTTALLQPKHGSVTINTNGTVIYTPNPGYVGKDTFEYNVCSTPSPVVCDIATVYVDIAVCPAPFNQNVIAGDVFLDKNDDGVNNDGGTGVPGAKVYLYVDGNCNTVIDANELVDSVIVDSTGNYQFVTYPEKFVEDDFDGPGGARTCNNGSDGTGAWATDWVDAGDPSTGAGNAAFCVSPAQSQANTDAEIYKDGAFTNAIRLKDNNVSVTRRVNLAGASYAFLSFSYRRKSALVATHDVIVQASKDGATFGTVFTIAGDGTSDAAYVNIYNQDITQYASATVPTYIRFLTNNNVADGDTVYIDNVKIQFIRYPICYITRMDSTTIPAYHHKTTILQRNVTATGTQTCLAPFDFGIAKNKITISGTLYHDANGLVDSLVNGTAMGNITGSAVYAYLVDSTGKVVRRTTLNSSTGFFSFPDADVYTNYSLRLSTISVNLGDPPPADAGTSYVAGNWTPTGELYGTGNAVGTGIKPGVANCIVPVSTGVANVTNVNVGIERLPDSDDKNINYTINTPGLKYDISTGLTGSDPEDGVYGSGKTYKITQLPAGAKLYYNNIVVTLNQVISNFNPALLKIDPDDQTHTTYFKYASRDAAGFYDPSPATVTVSWNQTLPVKLISFSGRLNGTKVDLNWVTANELNTKQFEVERGSDGISFTKIGAVAAKGNSNTATSYDFVDPSPLAGVNYYRLKIVDIDGKFEYSQIVIIRIDNSIQLITKVAPNPFTGKIDVYLTLTHNTAVDFRFIDINGRMVFSKSVKGLKGFNWFTINDLDKLPSAPYMLHIKTDDATIVEKLIKQQQ
jgi:Bacterial Ig domain